MAVGGIVLGSLILYFKGMRIMMFQLSGFYYTFWILQGVGALGLIEIPVSGTRLGLAGALD